MTKKNYSVTWTPVATKDLTEVIDFVAQDKPEFALTLLHSVRQKASTLKLFPERGRKLPELKNLITLPFKELIIAPWRLIYKIENQQIDVLAFVDSRRNLEDLLHQRLLR